MSVSSISEKNKYLLWVKSGGNCQYRGCNTPLFEDILTKRNFNQSYIAHIVADVPGGPRGCSTRSPLLADDINNLMLLCDRHHRLIDKDDVAGHPESLLLEMKKAHEDRIKTVTSITEDLSSHVIIYKANIGENHPVLTYEVAKHFVMPARYPAFNGAIDLGLTNSAFRDKNDTFWKAELETLETHFTQKVRPLIQSQEIKHISLFALAPMPLLIKLGTLMNDVNNMVVHQPVREPKTWKLEEGEEIQYTIHKPAEKKANAALNISLSGTITDDRVTDVIGDDVSIYTLTIEKPSNDYLRKKGDLAAFRKHMRELFDEIKKAHGTGQPLHVFPAMPVATAIEMGRVWMPKADMSLQIYDHNAAKGGFTPALTISHA